MATVGQGVVVEVTKERNAARTMEMRAPFDFPRYFKVGLVSEGDHFKEAAMKHSPVAPIAVLPDPRLERAGMA